MAVLHAPRPVPAPVAAATSPAASLPHTGRRHDWLVDDAAGADGPRYRVRCTICDIARITSDRHDARIWQSSQALTCPGPPVEVPISRLHLLPVGTRVRVNAVERVPQRFRTFLGTVTAADAVRRRLVVEPDPDERRSAPLALEAKTFDLLGSATPWHSVEAW